MSKLLLTRISESIIREVVKPFKDDYGRTYAASRYIRVAQRQLEADRQCLADKIGADMPSITRYSALQYIRDLCRALKG